MDIFGSFALLLAFLATVYAFVAGIVGIVTRRTLLTKSARNAGMAVFGLITLAVASLEYFFFTDDFSLAYVAAHSNHALPLYYKFSALWAGQEGSLLWWSWLLSIYVFLALFLNRKKHPELMPYVGVILAGVQTFFLVLNNFVASPFHVLASADSAGVMHMARLSEGSGLNPLLQYPEMVIHPPMLYLGYTGFTIPFAFALAALLGRYPGEKWIHITRRWTMVAWCFQGIGVLLGAHWAYAVLGWGGYWAWDPVENAALLPWITGTAVHPGNFADADGHRQLGARVRGIVHWWLVFRVPRDRFRRVPHSVVQESRLPAQRQSARLAGLARIELPLQQFDFAGRVLRRSVGNALPCALGMGDWQQDQRGAAVLQ